MLCKNCGMYTDSIDFCPICGAPLNDDDNLYEDEILKEYKDNPIKDNNETIEQEKPYIDVYDITSASLEDYNFYDKANKNTEEDFPWFANPNFAIIDDENTVLIDNNLLINDDSLEEEKRDKVKKESNNKKITNAKLNIFAKKSKHTAKKATDRNINNAQTLVGDIISKNTNNKDEGSDSTQNQKNINVTNDESIKNKEALQNSPKNQTKQNDNINKTAYIKKNIQKLRNKVKPKEQLNKITSLFSKYWEIFYYKIIKQINNKKTFNKKQWPKIATTCVIALGLFIGITCVGTNVNHMIVYPNKIIGAASSVLLNGGDINIIKNGESVEELSVKTGDNIDDFMIACNNQDVTLGIYQHNFYAISPYYSTKISLSSDEKNIIPENIYNELVKSIKAQNIDVKLSYEDFLSMVKETKKDMLSIISITSYAKDYKYVNKNNKEEYYLTINLNDFKMQLINSIDRNFTDDAKQVLGDYEQKIGNLGFNSTPDKKVKEEILITTTFENKKLSQVKISDKNEKKLYYLIEIKNVGNPTISNKIFDDNKDNVETDKISELIPDIKFFYENFFEKDIKTEISSSEKQNIDYKTGDIYFDKTAINMPIKYSDFEKSSGYSFSDKSDKDKTLEGEETVPVYLKKGDSEIMISLKNDTKEKIKYSDAMVCGIEFNTNTNEQPSLFGYLKIGQSITSDEIIKRFGEPSDKYSEDGFELLNYISNEYNIYYEIAIKDNKIIRMSCYISATS